MPRPLTAADLRRLADDMDAEDQEVTVAGLQAEVEELKGRKPSREEIIEALGGPEGVREFLAEHEEPEPKPEPEPTPAVEPKPKPEPKAKVRPGRKSGLPYMWTTDEEGNVQRTDIATIYTGPDEDEEVPLPEKTEAA